MQLVYALAPGTRARLESLPRHTELGIFRLDRPKVRTWYSTLLHPAAKPLVIFCLRGVASPALLYRNQLTGSFLELTMATGFYTWSTPCNNFGLLRFCRIMASYPVVMELGSKPHGYYGWHIDDFTAFKNHCH